MAIYYVSPIGNNSYNGLYRTFISGSDGPWLTFQKAATTVVAGDTVIFLDGTYTGSGGSYVALLSNSGSTGNYITYRSENPAILDIGGSSHAIIDAAFTQQYCINMNIKHFIKFDGFEFKRANGAASCAIEGQGSHDVFVTNCYIHHIGTNYNGNDGFGIDGIATSNSVLPASYNWTVDCCVFTDIGRIGGSGGVGVWTDGTNRSDANTGCADHALYFLGHDITITNCLFYNTDTVQYGDFRGEPIQFVDGSTPNTDLYNILIANNTIYGASVYDHPGHIIVYAYSGGVMTDITVANNLSIGTSQFLLYATATGATGCLASNNITGATSLQRIVNGAPSNAFTDTDNTINYASDPFTDKDTYDFTLVAASAPISAANGTYLPDHDLIATERPQGAAGDIGAYEYVSDIVRTYSRGSYGSLPSDDTDLTTIYSAQDYLDVADDDGTRVGKSGNGYVLHQFKDVAGPSDTKVDLHCNLQAPLAPSAYPVYLQCLDRVTAGGMWVTVVTDNTSSANTDFDMDFQLNSGTTPTFANCKDADGVISSRVYQTNVPLM